MGLQKNNSKPLGVNNDIWNIVWKNRENIFDTDFHDNMIKLAKCFWSF